MGHSDIQDLSEATPHTGDTLGLPPQVCTGVLSDEDHMRDLTWVGGVSGSGDELVQVISPHTPSLPRRATCHHHRLSSVWWLLPTR